MGILYYTIHVSPYENTNGFYLNITIPQSTVMLCKSVRQWSNLQNCVNIDEKNWKRRLHTNLMKMITERIKNHVLAREKKGVVWNMKTLKRGEKAREISYSRRWSLWNGSCAVRSASHYFFSDDSEYILSTTTWSHVQMHQSMEWSGVGGGIWLYSVGTFKNLKNL